MKRATLRYLAAMALLVLCLSVSGSSTGCGKSTAPQGNAKLDRVDQIVKASGGDWNRVSPEDRTFLINEVGKGSPISAQMTFGARAGMLKPGAGVKH